jgi:hypothetical protein
MQIIYNMTETCFNTCFSPVTIEHALGLIIKDDNIKLFKKEKFDRLYYIFKDKESEVLYESFCENQGGNPFSEIITENFIRSELSLSTLIRLRKIFKNMDDDIISSTSEEDKDDDKDNPDYISSGPIDIYSTSHQSMKYPTIKKEYDIISIKFMSDKNYTLDTLFKEITTIFNIDQLLIKIKRCLIYVVVDSKWYAWTGATIIKLNKETKSWSTGISGIKGTSDFVNIKLGWILDDMKHKFDFSVREYADINKELLLQSTTNPDPTSTVPKTLSTIDMSMIIGEKKIEPYTIIVKELPLTHRFIRYRMNITGLNKIQTGKKLYEAYASWKQQELITTSDNKFKSELLADPITSTILFTGTFKKKDKISPGDMYYLDDYGTNKLVIKSTQHLFPTSTSSF